VPQREFVNRVGSNGSSFLLVDMGDPSCPIGNIAEKYGSETWLCLAGTLALGLGE
jgi:hypothetical protein